MDPVDAGGDLVGPGPAGGDPEPEPAATAEDTPGHGEDPQPHLFGFHRRAGLVKASICLQASSSHASATISHQTWFCAKPRSGSLRSPVSLVARILGLVR